MDAEEAAIKVCCRVRPAGANPADKLGKGQQQKVVVTSGKTVVVGQEPETRSFVFDYLAGENSTQEELWTNVGLEVCQATLQGYHGTVIAYGQTGSGKTHTIFGTETDKGIVPRALDYIFAYIGSERAREDSRNEYQVTCTYVEIYNERLFDLLDPNADSARQIQLREDSKRGVFVEGAVEEIVQSPIEAHHLLALGNKNRHVGSTVMNRASSRSHAIFLLTIQMTSENEDGLRTQRLSRFNLVDLAGSERQKATQTSGVQLREAGQINKSLSALGNVIHALTAKGSGAGEGGADISPLKATEGAAPVKHVAYRDSKLTFLLRDSLGGSSKTVIVATVTTLESSMAESLNSLKFAVRAKKIKNKLTKNETLSQGTLAALQREVLQLRARLAAMEEEQTCRDRGGTDDVNQASSLIPAPPSSPGCLVSRTRSRTLSGAGNGTPNNSHGHNSGTGLVQVNYRSELMAALERCQAADELRIRSEHRANELERQLEAGGAVGVGKEGEVEGAKAHMEEVLRLRAALEEIQVRSQL